MSFKTFLSLVIALSLSPLPEILLCITITRLLESLPDLFFWITEYETSRDIPLHEYYNFISLYRLDIF